MFDVDVREEHRTATAPLPALPELDDACLNLIEYVANILDPENEKGDPDTTGLAAKLKKQTLGVAQERRPTVLLDFVYEAYLKLDEARKKSINEHGPIEGAPGDKNYMSSGFIGYQQDLLVEHKMDNPYSLVLEMAKATRGVRPNLEAERIEKEIWQLSSLAQRAGIHLSSWFSDPAFERGEWAIGVE